MSSGRWVGNLKSAQSVVGVADGWGGRRLGSSGEGERGLTHRGGASRSGEGDRDRGVSDALFRALQQEMLERGLAGFRCVCVCVCESVCESVCECLFTSMP